MTCGNCGAAIADKAIVCYRCGTPTADPAAATARVQRPRRTPWIALLLCAAILAASGWVLVRADVGSIARWIGWGGIATALLGAAWLARRR